MANRCTLSACFPASRRLRAQRFLRSARGTGPQCASSRKRSRQSERRVGRESRRCASRCCGRRLGQYFTAPLESCAARQTPLSATGLSRPCGGLSRAGAGSSAHSGAVAGQFQCLRLSAKGLFALPCLRSRLWTCSTSVWPLMARRAVSSRPTQNCTRLRDMTSTVCSRR